MERAVEEDPAPDPEIRPKSEVENGYTAFINGDVLVAKITPCFENGKGAVVERLENGVGFGTTEFHVFRPDDNLNNKFLYYTLTTRVLRDVGKTQMTGSAGQQRVPASFFANFNLPVPPRPEQDAIVAYLDGKLESIDRYLRVKEREIELLEERKRALIHRAVTRGLDPNPQLQPSGIPWLPEIPAGWEECALCRKWEVLDCKHLTVPFEDEGYLLASVREAQRFDLDLTDAKKTSEPWYRMLIEGRRKPAHGDLIYCRNTSVGAAAFVGPGHEDFAMGQDVCLIRSIEQNQRFLNYLFRSHFMAEQLDTVLVGSTFKRMAHLGISWVT